MGMWVVCVQDKLLTRPCKEKEQNNLLVSLHLDNSDKKKNMTYRLKKLNNNDTTKTKIFSSVTFLYISVTQCLQSQSRLHNHKFTYLPLPLLFPVDHGQLVVVLLLQMFSPISGNIKIFAFCGTMEQRSLKAIQLGMSWENHDKQDPQWKSKLLMGFFFFSLHPCIICSGEFIAQDYECSYSKGLLL